MKTSSILRTIIFVGAFLQLFVVSGLIYGQVSAFQPEVATGGRAVAIAVHPNNANVILVASESGGLFRTINRGVSWTHVPGLLNHRISDVAFSPADPNIVIAAAASNFRIPNDGGVWRSIDGGITWTRPATAIPLPSARCTDRPSAYAVAFEAGSTAVFVGTDCGLAISFDNGATWTHRQLDLLAPINTARTQNAVFSVVANREYLLAAAADGLWRSVTRGILPGFRIIIRNGAQTIQTGQSDLLINHAFAVSLANSNHVFFAGGGQQLFMSVNGGTNWTLVPTIASGNGRPAFVRVTSVRLGNLFVPDVYFGNGQRLYHQRFTPNGGTLTGGGWMQPGIDHDDPSDIGFDRNGVPVLLATDGGVHTTPNGGNTWQLTGGGSGGFNALQIYEVFGQAISGATPHQDLYYATQDNQVMGSADAGRTWPFQNCCEGGTFRIVPVSAPDHVNTHITGMVCGPCNNSRWGAHLSNPRPFINPPDGDLQNDIDGNPFPISVGSYIQNTINNDIAAPVNNFVLTQNNAGNWRNAFTISPSITGQPAIAGPTLDPTVYVAVRRPGTRIGLVKATNFLGGGGFISNADGNNFGSIGASLFTRVFAVNPANPLHLIYADTETGQMKFSVDGGQNWFVDQPLTNLVTGNGTFVFNKGEVSHARNISFDPNNPCVILVGTDQNGIIRSADGGNTWTKIAGSEAITAPSFFYFPPTGPITVSTYGRGLWQLSNRAAQTVCPKQCPPQQPRYSGRSIDISTGVSVPFLDMNNPPLCLNCNYILVRNGVINDLEMKENKVTAVGISSGSVHQVDSTIREITLMVPNKFVSAQSTFDQLPKLRSLLAEKDTKIRAIVVEGDTLRNIIVSEIEFPFAPSRIPYVRLTSMDMAGSIKTETGGKVRVHGEGFVSSTGGEGRVRILLGEEIVAQDIVVDKEGNFMTDVAVKRMRGDYEIIVEQQTGRRLIRENAKVNVVYWDGPRN